MLGRIGLLASTGALLALTTVLGKVAPAAGLSPVELLGGASLLAGALLMDIGRVRRAAPPIDARTLEYWLLAALLGFAAPTLLLLHAVPVVGVGFGALALSFPPLLTYAGAVLLGIERLDARRALGVCCALAGAAWLAAGRLQVGDARPAWIASTLLVPVLLAAGNLYRTVRWPPGASPASLVPGMLFAAVLLLAAWALATGDRLPGLRRWHAGLWLVALQGLAFAVQYTLFFRLQASGGPVWVSLLGSVAALVGVPTAVLLLDESVPSGLAAAAVLIAAGVVLVLGANPPRHRPAGRSAASTTAD